MRMRSDLSVCEQRYQGQTFLAVKDPIALNYFCFQEEEYAILEMLDGRTSLDELKRRFERRFAPQKITVEELGQFIGTLHHNSLIVSESPGQGEQLALRSVQRARKQRVATLSNVLCVRLKGFDPDRLLAWLCGKVGWIFSIRAIVASVVLMVGAILLVTVQWDVFQSKLPAFHDFFAARNWVWLALTLALTKVLHEIGHGLACKRFGGECHEMGVMILVLTPCLYCNVSDSWMLPSKWHRAAIGAAGVYVEILLASICTFVWWNTHPGMLNYLCLNVMFVSSVSTILFNANPLLRYDGYYVLSDLAEIPNLRQKASRILRQKMASWTLGIEPRHDPFLPKRGQIFFALYTVAAGAYRWFVTLSILCFLNRVFEPYGLKIVGQMIALAALYGLAIHPLWQLGKFFHVPGRIDKVKKSRVLLVLAEVATGIFVVLLFPLPYRVSCSLLVQPREAKSVYVEVPGTLVDFDAKPGQKVDANQPLGRLENLDLQLATVQLEGEQARMVARLANLRQRAFTDDAAGAEIAQVEESLAAIDEQLRRRRRDLLRLEVVAPAAGTLLPPPPIPPATADSGRLPTWSGMPFQEKNLGAYLSSGVLLGQIGDPQRLEAIIVIDQSEIEFVRPGQRVDLQLEQLPGEEFTGRIEQVSSSDLKISPRSLSAKSGGGLVTRTDSSGHERPVSTTYQASIPLTDREGIILLGTRGHAQIHAGYQTIGARLWRYVSRTFRFQT